MSLDLKVFSSFLAGELQSNVFVQLNIWLEPEHETKRELVYFYVTEVKAREFNICNGNEGLASLSGRNIIPPVVFDPNMELKDWKFFTSWMLSNQSAAMRAGATQIETSVMLMTAEMLQPISIYYTDSLISVQWRDHSHWSHTYPTWSSTRPVPRWEQLMKVKWLLWKKGSGPISFCVHKNWWGSVYSKTLCN